MYSYIGHSVLNDHLGSSTDPCYIQNRVITNRVIKRLRCICKNKGADQLHCDCPAYHHLGFHFIDSTQNHLHPKSEISSF